MAELPLYYSTMWPCSCCGLDREFVFMSQSDQTICASCRRHGQDADKRNLLHRNWWMQFNRQQIAAHAKVVDDWREAVKGQKEQIAARDIQIADLKAVVLDNYDKTALGEIQGWLQSQVVQQAEERMRGAYRSRDRVMGAIWRLDRLHSDAKKAGMCTCGKTALQCKERVALDPVLKTLDGWEAKQIELVKKDLEHHLPQEHPEVQKRRRVGWVA